MASHEDPSDHERATHSSTEDDDEQGVNLLRAFSVETFQDWPSWRRLARLLTPGPTPPPANGSSPSTELSWRYDVRPRGGGAYGLAGPRGAGKTWHMQRAVEMAREESALGQRGLGLWYPSPSEYESLAFLASLTETFANEVERARRDTTTGYAQLGLPPIFALFALYGGLLVGGGVWALMYYVALADLVVSILVGIVGGLIGVTLVLAWRRWRRARTPRGRMELYARELRRTVRFSTTLHESTEMAASAGKSIIGKLRRSRDLQLVERPLTLATLVQDFRELVRLAGVATYPAPVVVAIDELDKMTEHDKVRQLLRDIKGIFGVPNVYFLVSVSHEAARALNLNGLTERNEFNSSFDTVVELPALDVAKCARLLESRGFPACPPVSEALGVLSAGIPRELVRLGELVLSDSVAGPLLMGGSSSAVAESPLVLTAAIASTMRVESTELVREVVAGGAPLGPTISDTAKVGVFAALRDDRFDPETFVDFASQTIGAHWKPEWADDAWEDRFGESWRRLMVRLAIAANLTDSRSDREYLRRVVAVSSQSAAVAREMLGAPESTPKDPPGNPLQRLVDRIIDGGR